MFSLETTLMGVALALDAAVVSFAVGIMNLDSRLTHKISRGMMVCSLFGFFQFLMVWLGSLGGYFLSFSGYGYLFQLVVALIFGTIGIKVLQESFKSQDEPIEWGFLPMVILAVATSIDALAAGVSMGTIPFAYISALEIGLITFLVCAVAFFSSNFLKSFPTRWLLRFAACIFFFLSGQILINYYF